MTRWKVAIVGGGPSGIATALFFAHHAPHLADRIVVLEKARYPREKFCAGAVGARADKLLSSIGIRVDVPSVSIDGLAFRALGETATVREPRIGRVVRRIEFDAELARLARDRGISIAEGTLAESIEIEPRGVTVRTNQGEYRADAVVGADGVTSLVRRALQIPTTPYRAQALEVDTPPVADDLDRDLLLFDVSDRSLNGYYWDFPTIVDGEEQVCRGVYYLKPTGEHSTVEIQTILARQLSRRGLDLDRCKRKRFAERGFHPSGAVGRPRALLVGEAAGIDPVTGEGIAQAIQYGAVAGRYLAKAARDRDFEFSDWPSEIRSTIIGRDLYVRAAALPLFYGPRRPSVERFLLSTPDFIRVGLQHFGGKRWSPAAVGRGAWGALKATAGAFLGAAVS